MSAILEINKSHHLSGRVASALIPARREPLLASHELSEIQLGVPVIGSLEDDRFSR